MNEKRPNSSKWHRAPQIRMAEAGEVLAYSVWETRRGVRVISALQLADLPDGSGEIGPQWHISISNKGKRPKTTFTTLRAFGMAGAEEDNHHPGIARHFWMPVDPARRVDCECKEVEETIVEPDGYRWQNPKEGDGECRGCEFERMMGKRCPIHG